MMTIDCSGDHICLLPSCVLSLCALAKSHRAMSRPRDPRDRGDAPLSVSVRPCLRTLTNRHRALLGYYEVRPGSTTLHTMTALDFDEVKIGLRDSNERENNVIL